MFRARISVAVDALELPLKEALNRAMELGAQGVQLDVRNTVTASAFGDTARRQLLHSLNERSLRPASAVFPLRHSLIDPDRLDERLNSIRAAMDLCSKLRLPVLLLRFGRIPGEERPGQRDLLINVLNDLAATGDRLGVQLALTPGPDGAEALGGLLDAIKAGAVGVNADLGGWALNGMKPAQQFRALARQVIHVDVRDAIQDLDGPGREVPVGRGEIDWDEIAALLDEAEYHGWLNVTRTAGNDRAGDVARAVQYLRNLLPQG